MNSATRPCAYCGEERVWEWNGGHLKDGSKIFMDEAGAKWAGRRCPPCEKLRVKAALTLTSHERLAALEELKARGYTCSSHAFPLRAAKDGLSYRVGLQFAALIQDKVELEGDYVGENCDFYLLVFRSVRLVTRSQWNQLRPAGVDSISPQNLLTYNDANHPTL